MSCHVVMLHDGDAAAWYVHGKVQQNHELGACLCCVRSSVSGSSCEDCNMM